MKQISRWLLPTAGWLAPGVAMAQDRMYEWHWEMHPRWWWGQGIGMMAMMLLFWLLVIAGFIIGLRWLLGKGRGGKDDAALKILRERYARGEINKEEFEAKKEILVPEPQHGSGPGATFP